ncbi:FtsX-like permease family protein [Salinibacterium sp. ZJ77]|uniref:ABC transporter permease n=1 Tax=Salinibacterium sp. ZJ77 TaxID=2708337 RepID=UPI0014247B55|nr:FtsX-like permease family protein [Salinibacterium sp. ZJ77]
MSADSTTTGLREHASSILVAGLSAAFGVSLLQVTGVLADAIRADDVTGSSGTVRIMLVVLAFVFLTISVYVGAVVTSNTFATIVAGRTRTIALMRLIGSSARAQRRAVAREGLVVGLIGATAGAVVGTALALGLERLAVVTGQMPDMAHNWFDPVLAFPIVGVIATTWLASWVGARKVLTVTPLQALGSAQPMTLDESSARRGRNAVAATLSIVGFLFLVLAVLVGLMNPLAVLIGLVGGILSFSGVVAGAHLVMPRALRIIGRLLGRSPAARLASENSLRYPERSTRTTIGVVIGVTLITTFGVATASFRQLISLAQAEQPEVYEGIDEMLNVVTAVFSTLIGVSALIAAVGLVNSLSLSVLQRTRELGLLRALGFSSGQLRRMVFSEAVQLTSAAVVVGLMLGVFYGWVGAQSLLGAIKGSPGIVAPGVPWLLIGIVVVGAAVLTIAASIAPARRAIRVSPITALAVD